VILSGDVQRHPMSTLVSGSLIARLCLHTRKWAHEHLRRGSFGPVIERNGVLFAELAGVEQHLGLSFDQAQIVAAGRPDQYVILNEEAAHVGAQ
jgi:hypothetical protein